MAFQLCIPFFLTKLSSRFKFNWVLLPLLHPGKVEYRYTIADKAVVQLGSSLLYSTSVGTEIMDTRVKALTIKKRRLRISP